MNEKSNIEITIIKESLAESLISDFSTFSFLLLCIWASWKTDSTFWQFVLGTMGLTWVVAKVKWTVSTSVKKFSSYREAYDWLGKQIGESQ